MRHVPCSCPERYRTDRSAPVGCHAAFTEIYERYYGILYAHAVKFLHDEAEVSDILPELLSRSGPEGAT